jgi:dimethylargininase
VTLPGAPSRRDEVVSVVDAVRSWAPALRLARIEAPGTLEGGDVLVFGTTVAIGVSERTNEEGARQLAAHAATLGYRSRLCPVEDRLHLASEVSAIGGQRLIGTEQGFASLRRSRPIGDEEHGWLTGVAMIEVPASESPAANVLAVNGTCILPAGYPAARAALEAAGETVVEVELDQFTRADGGPTCLVAFVPG